ncbi:MAG TPA: cupin domain-containing protein [Spirochaetia bacterium]|nr:cupin domain-containing protein [Spirochaetia bacterium]
MAKPKPYYKPFLECDPYTQKDAAGLSFRKVLPQGIIDDVNMGLVTAEGPTHKLPGTHNNFDQVYLVFKGKGTVHLGGEKMRIEEPGIIVIPRGTEHSMEVDAGQTMAYVYVNRVMNNAG